MLRKCLVLTTIALMGIVPVAANAQPGPGWGPNQGGRGWNGPEHGGPGRGDPGHFRRGRDDWRRGDRFDRWRDQRYVVNDWNGYRGLYAPPRGYYWVRNGNQFLLTAIASGLIGAVVVSTAPMAGGMMPPPPPVVYPPGYY
ncbi:RcnB family protein [Brytella acorum]|uniref:RcnB family protein n=1 Tax=Brytella acorum TaxID=2959299 RepID=A0AA35VBH2_9PROT|nr:RcnB family protein [Brytella acorum]MDF3625788.1 RcnB family protein [Brytella acorum]CAI9121217.1 RcnB family protein [Brytella acorum]